MSNKVNNKLNKTKQKPANSTMLLGADISSEFANKKELVKQSKIAKNKLNFAENFAGNEGDATILQVVDNPHIDCNYIIRFTCPEFTSICPITSQPDFAHLIFDYLPNKKIVESKSLKLYLHSFRNHGAFHEDCTIKIAKDLIAITNAKWLRIAGYWYPRGGIPIDIFYQQGELPKNTFVPELNVANYRGRG
jgi:7-cyano-7-deazaguanine reductase